MEGEKWRMNTVVRLSYWLAQLFNVKLSVLVCDDKIVGTIKELT